MGRIMLATSNSTDEEYGGTLENNEITISTEPGVTNYDNLCIESQKIVSGHFAMTVSSASASTWTKIASTPKKPVKNYVIPFVNDGTGNVGGMILIAQSNGDIRIYPTTAINNATIHSTVIYKTTD